MAGRAGRRGTQRRPRPAAGADRAAAAQQPGLAIDPARLDSLPRALRDTLLAPPLVQAEDGSFLLWDDPSA